MVFSARGGKRWWAISAAVVALVVSACSPQAPAPDEQSSSDSRASDTVAVEELVDRYWRAVVESENQADADPQRFAGIADGPPLERHLKVVRDYEEAGIHRVGEPHLTAVEVEVSGDIARIAACLNEDEWTAEQHGTTMKAPKLGPVPWGARASLRDGSWIITGVRVPADGSKDC